MTFVARNTGGDFTPAPQGTHIARCVQLIDLGTQYSEFYKKSARKLLVGWELPGEKKPDTDDVFLVWKRYTLSLSDNAHLRRDLEGWRGKKFTAEELQAFDVLKVLGHGCLLSIVHDERDGTKYTNVQSVSALTKGTKCPERINDLLEFDVDNPNWEAFNLLSERLQETINNSAERKAATAAADARTEPTGQGEDDLQRQMEEADDIPF